MDGLGANLEFSTPLWETNKILILFTIYYPKKRSLARKCFMCHSDVAIKYHLFQEAELYVLIITKSERKKIKCKKKCIITRFATVFSTFFQSWEIFHVFDLKSSLYDCVTCKNKHTIQTNAFHFFDNQPFTYLDTSAVDDLRTISRLATML